MNKINREIDIETANNTVSDFGETVLQGNGIMRVDEQGVYFMKYGCRTDLVLFHKTKDQVKDYYEEEHESEYEPDHDDYMSDLD